MNKRFRAAFLLVLLAGGCDADSSGAPATSQGFSAWEVSEDLQIERIAADVFVHTSWRLLGSGARFPSNGLIVREGDRVVLVDTAWGVEPTEQLLAWIDETLRLPVARVLATHFHADRMGGAPVLAARGIPLIAQAGTIERAVGQDAPRPESLGELAAGEAIQLGSLEVFFPGPAHSQDNVIVWLPASKVLFGGCAVKSLAAGGLGNTADAEVASWPDAIRRVQARYPNSRLVVPGHGPSGDMTLLSHTLSLLEAAAD